MFEPAREPQFAVSDLISEGWVHVGCYADEVGLRKTLERIERLWAGRYHFRVVHAPCAAGDYRLFVRHR